jgi:hypothetical protein
VAADAVYIGLFYLLDLKENPNSPDTAGHIYAVESIVEFLLPLIQHHVIADRGVRLLKRLLSPAEMPSVSNRSHQQNYSDPVVDLPRLEQRLRVHPRGLAKISEGTQNQNQQTDLGTWPGVEIEEGVWDPLWEGMNDASGHIFLDEAWLTPTIGITGLNTQFQD